MISETKLIIRAIDDRWTLEQVRLFITACEALIKLGFSASEIIKILESSPPVN